MTNYFNSASLEVFLDACSTKDLRPLVRRHIPTMLNSPKPQQVLALVAKLCTAESKDTHDLDFPEADTSMATEEDNQVWDTTPNFLFFLIVAQDGEGVMCLIKGQLSVPNPQSLEEMDQAVHTLATEWTYREDNKGVGYVAKEPGAQLIKNMTHIKKSNREMADEIKELLLWKADVNSSLRRLRTSAVTGQKIRSRFIENFKAHQVKDRKNIRTIREGDDAAHLGSGAEDAQMYYDGIRTDGHIYAELYGIPINEVSEYFGRFQSPFNTIKQNTKLTQFNRSTTFHENSRQSWHLGSQRSSQFRIQITFPKTPRFVANIQIANRESSDPSVTR